MSIRAATENDLDVITSIMVVAAGSADAGYQYRFPYRDRFPEDFARSVRARCWRYLSESLVMVYELPTMAGNSTEVVGFSVWELPASQNPVNVGLARLRDTSIAPAQRREADGTRIRAFKQAFANAKRDFFYAQYGNEYLFLSILACHPAYQRTGIATKLASWGLEKANRDGVTTTVFATSDMGFGLYLKLGFRTIGRIVIQVEGEDEALEVPALVKDCEERGG